MIEVSKATKEISYTLRRQIGLNLPEKETTVLQTKVKPKNEKSSVKFAELEMSTTKLAAEESHRQPK